MAIVKEIFNSSIFIAIIKEKWIHSAEDTRWKLPHTFYLIFPY